MSVPIRNAFPKEIWPRAAYERMDGDDVIVHFAEDVETTECLDELAVAADDVRWL